MEIVSLKPFTSPQPLKSLHLPGIGTPQPPAWAIVLPKFPKNTASLLWLHVPMAATFKHLEELYLGK